MNGSELNVVSEGIESQERVGMITINSSLTLLGLDLDDIGQYSCFGSNILVESRNDTSDPLVLEVLRELYIE